MHVTFPAEPFNYRGLLNVFRYPLLKQFTIAPRLNLVWGAGGGAAGVRGSVERQVCHDYQNGCCGRGKNCKYEHSDDDNYSKGRQEGRQVCHDYENGRCDRGNNCKYWHVDDDNSKDHTAVWGFAAEIAALTVQKKHAAANEDYDKALALKERITELEGKLGPVKAAPAPAPGQSCIVMHGRQTNDQLLDKWVQV